MKHERPGSTSTLGESRQAEHNGTGSSVTPRKCVGARAWEGIDLNRPVGEGRLTFEQASSIMRLRQVIAKPVPHASGEEVMAQSMRIDSLSCSYGLHRYGLHSNGLHRYGLHSYGLCIYGPEHANRQPVM